MAMNTSKVITGGLAAGLVLNVLDFIVNKYIVGARMAAEANVFKAGLGDAMMAMGGKQIAGYVIMDFVVGLLLTYTYAAMRPRFGAGAKTAVITALVFWIFGSIVAVNYMAMGIMSSGLWLTFGIIWFICLLVAAMVGGKLYSEDGATA